MTTTINLLPWREERRERKRRFFFICLGVSGVMAVAIVIMAFTTFNSLIEHQTTRNQLIEDEIARYNQQLIKIKKLKKVRVSLIARMKVIQRLQESRTEIVHFFDELINIVPRSIYILEAKRTSDLITLTGHTDANSSVSLLMHNIEKNYWLNKSELEEVAEVTSKTKNKLFKQFRLKFILKPLNKMQEDGLDE